MQPHPSQPPPPPSPSQLTRNEDLTEIKFLKFWHFWTIWILQFCRKMQVYTEEDQCSFLKKCDWLDVANATSILFLSYLQNNATSIFILTNFHYFIYILIFFTTYMGHILFSVTITTKYQRKLTYVQVKKFFTIYKK